MKYKNKAYIDTLELKNNYLTILDLCKKNALAENKTPPKVICVVKADAYGHGIRTAAKVLGEAGCGFFAVSSEAEAVELRHIESENGRHPEILILGHIMPENVPDMIENDITCAICDAENARELSEAVSPAETPLKVHIKLDTGMNRVGFPTDDLRFEQTVCEIAEISREKNLKITGIFTHFSSADDELLDGHLVPGFDEGYTAMQLSRYKRVIDSLKKLKIDVGLRHSANSAALLKLPEAYFDAVRAGIILYGYPPNGSIDSRFRTVMRFDSSVVHIHTVKRGEKISYGAAFEAPYDMTVATIGAGYADGFEREYSGCDVKIGERKYRQVGRICMDQCMIDVTPPRGEECAVKVGDAVTLFGGDGGESVNELARRAGTISYEVLCRVSKRVPRIEA